MDAPIRIGLHTPAPQPDGFSLYDWLKRDPDYRPSVSTEPAAPAERELGIGELVVNGALAPAALVGFFGVVRAWIAAQRQETSLRVTVDGAEVELEMTGRTDPNELAGQVLAVARDRPPAADESDGG